MSYGIKLTKSKTQPKATAQGQPAQYKISNAYLYYINNTGYGALKYGEEADEDFPAKNKQYELNVLITKDIAKVFKKHHKKLSVSECSAEEFEGKYKVEPPFKAEDYYFVKLYREAFIKYGEKAGEPCDKVPFITKTGESLAEVGIGNGSLGHVIVNFGFFDHKKWGTGTTMRLGAVQVIDLIEYVVNDKNGLDEFDIEEEEEEDMLDALASEGSEEEGADDNWDDDTPF